MITIFMDSEEAVSHVVNLLSGKWTVKVFFKLGKQAKTFTNISKEIDGISNKMLSKTLNNLKDEEVVTEAKSVNGYILTEKGVKLRKNLEGLTEWREDYSGSSKKVLIVENDSDQAELYSKWLKEFETVKVEPEEVIDKSESNTLAVIMDRYLEKQESDRFVKYISEADIPVVICSGVEPRIEDTNLPFYNYLIKPLNREILEKTVKQIENLEESEIKLESLKNKKKLIQERNIGNPQERKDRLVELNEEISKLS